MKPRQKSYQCNIYLLVMYVSMTTLLTDTVAHSTKPSFRPKTPKPQNPKTPRFYKLQLNHLSIKKITFGELSVI